MNPLLLSYSALNTMYCRLGNINPMSIAYATRLGLGPTNPGTIIVAQETLLFRWAGFSPALWLLIPAFSLDNAPPNLAVQLQRRYQRSSTTRIQNKTYYVLSNVSLHNLRLQVISRRSI